MKTSALDTRAHREIHQSAIALQSLSDRLEEEGLRGMDTQTAESIPAIINAASTALATARSADLESPLVDYLEAEIFRVSQLLRRVQRPSYRGGLTRLFGTIPELLWRTAPAQIFALLILLCGVMIGYRTAMADILLALSFFPEAAGGFSIGEQLLTFGDPAFASTWLKETYADVLTLFVTLDGQLVLFFAAFAAAALLSVWLGGLLTPLLLLSMGGAVGALLGVLPRESVMEGALRLFPIISMSSLAMILAQAGGVQVIRALLPATDGRSHRRRARELQSALLCTFLGVLHLVAGVLLTVLSLGPWELGLTSSLIAIGWLAVYTLYVGLFGSGLMRHVLPNVESYFQRVQADAGPYAEPPPSVNNGQVVLHLREGASTRVSLARLSDRLASYVVDSFIVLLGAGVVFWLAALILDEPSVTGVATLVAVVVLGIFSYFFWTEWRWQGQTIGKQLFEIQTVRLDGERLDGWTMWLRSVMMGAETALPSLLAGLSYFAAKRYIWFFVAVAFFATIGPMISPLFNAYRQRLADLITGTVTIEVPDLTRGLLPPVVSSKSPENVALQGMPLDARRHLILSSLVEQSRRGHLDGARAAVSTLAPHWNAHSMSDVELAASIETIYAASARVNSQSATTETAKPH